MTTLLKPDRVAEITGLAESTLAKMRVRGDGPPFAKMGARVLYPQAELDAWLADRLQLRHSTAEGTAHGAAPRARGSPEERTRSGLTRLCAMTRGSNERPVRRLLSSRFGDEYVVELRAQIIVIRPKGARRGGRAEITTLPGLVYQRAIGERIDREKMLKRRRTA